MMALLQFFFTKNSSQEWESDKLKRAHRNVTEVNGYDMEAWSLLIREAQNRWIGDVRPFFEQLVTVFPTTGRYWKIYIEQEVILILVLPFPLNADWFCLRCSLKLGI